MLKNQDRSRKRTKHSNCMNILVDKKTGPDAVIYLKLRYQIANQNYSL